MLQGDTQVLKIDLPTMWGEKGWINIGTNIITETKKQTIKIKVYNNFNYKYNIHVVLHQVRTLV